MAARKTGGLGRGLDALIPAKTAPTEKTSPKNTTDTSGENNQAASVQEKEAAVPTNGEMMVKLSKVEPNRSQPRKQFNEDALLELSESIKQYGILQPLLVSDKKDYYEIIAGERRWRAAKLAGLKEVPVIVKEFSEQEVVEISLIENIQRENLNAIEEASAYQYLIDHSGYTQEMVAQKVGKSRSAIANSLRLLSLSDKMKDDIVSGAMSAGHARAILSLINPADRELLRDKIVHEGLSVRDAEILAESYNKGHKLIQRKKSTEKDTEVVNIEEKFVSAVGARVEIKGSLDKGKLQIKFKSQKDLERLYALLSGGGVLFDE